MQDSPTCGTFKAIPVQIDESLSEEEEDLENTTESQKKSFLKSMIKAEKISQEGSAILDQVRGHALKHLSDLDIRKKEEEAAIAEEIKKKQEEIEEILRKKKEEEQLKRLDVILALILTAK